MLIVHFQLVLHLRIFQLVQCLYFCHLLFWESLFPPWYITGYSTQCILNAKFLRSYDARLIAGLMLNIYSSIALCSGLMECQWTTSMYTCDIYQYQFKIHLSFMHADHLDEVKHLDSAKWQDFQTSGTFCGSMQSSIQI